MNQFLNNFSTAVSNNIWLALLMSLLAGLVSSFSPCVLSSLPLIVGYIGGNSIKDKRVAFKYSILFSIGVTVTFTIFGVVAAILGRFLSGVGQWWYLLLAAIMLLAGLQLIGVISFGKRNSCKVSNTGTGLMGAFFLGILGGTLSSPCATPVLAAILSYVASEGSIALGVAMLVVYSIGHSALIILAGTSVGLVEQLSNSSRTYKIGNILKNILGVIIIIAGLYLFYLGII